jgi:Flp pilus assembly protein TadD
MWTLYELGLLAEEIYGGVTTILVYFLTGVAGSVASLGRDPLIVSAGASGAIFGVAGLLMSTLARDRELFHSRELKIALASLLAFAGYNLTYGFLKGGVDNGAHVGGLICGLALGAALGRGRIKAQRQTLSTRLSIALITLGCIVLGFAAVKSVRGEDVAIEAAKQDLQMGQADLVIRALGKITPKRHADEYFSLLAAAYAEKEQYDAAAAFYQKALQFNPNNASAHTALGLLLVRNGRLDDGRKQLEEAVKLNPSANAAWLELGLVWQRQGSFQESVRCLQKAATLDPGSALAYFALGISEMNLRQYDAAIAAFQRVTQLEPNDYRAQVWLGNAYAAKGDMVNAGAAYALGQKLRSAPRH